MKCPRCGKNKGMLIITDYRLKNIIRYESLCVDCDTELRKKHLSEIEMVYPYNL